MSNKSEPKGQRCLSKLQACSAHVSTACAARRCPHPPYTYAWEAKPGAREGWGRRVLKQTVNFRGHIWCFRTCHIFQTQQIAKLRICPGSVRFCVSVFKHISHWRWDKKKKTTNKWLQKRKYADPLSYTAADLFWTIYSCVIVDMLFVLSVDWISDHQAQMWNVSQVLQRCCYKLQESVKAY